MSNIFQATQIIRGTRANLVAANTVFPEGYTVIETDTGAIRFGDGSLPYSMLSVSVNDCFTKVKATDTSRVSNTTLANDPDLIFTMLANMRYGFKLAAWFDTTATADFKFAIDAPASPTLIRIVRRHIDPGALTAQVIASESVETPSTAVAAGTGTTGGFIEAEGIIHNGTSAGDLAFQWAQNTSDAGATIVRAGSYIEWRRF